MSEEGGRERERERNIQETIMTGKYQKCGECGKTIRGRKRHSGIYTSQVIDESTEFRSTQTGERFKIRQDIDCKSDNIIYLVTCKRRKCQGVGSCIKLSQRVSNYITSVEKSHQDVILKTFSEGRSFNC